MEVGANQTVGSSATIAITIAVVVVVVLLLCAAGVTISLITALRCVHKRSENDAEDDNRSTKLKDVVYDDVKNIMGADPSQITTEVNTAYGQFK